MRRCLGFAVLVCLLFLLRPDSIAAQHDSPKGFYVSPVIAIHNGQVRFNQGSKDTYKVNRGVALGIAAGYDLGLWRLELEATFQGGKEAKNRAYLDDTTLAGIDLAGYADQRDQLIEARRQELLGLSQYEGKAVEFESATDWRDIRTRSTRLMANAWFDFDLPWRVTPFAGAGVGLFHNKGV